VLRVVCRYVYELIIAKGKGGVVTYRVQRAMHCGLFSSCLQEYADAYYGDFLDCTLAIVFL